MKPRHQLSRWVFLSASAFALVALAVVWAGDPGPGMAGLDPIPNIIVVNTTVDEDGSGASCSLREAIKSTNGNTNFGGCSRQVKTAPDMITFSLGAGTPLIPITAPLPTVTGAVEINGGASRVELRGPGGAFVAGANGLTISASNTTIRNLVINNFPAAGIRGDGDNLIVEGNYIGMAADGVTAMGNAGFGVHVTGGAARIGGQTSGGPCTAPCNLIAGNQGSNVFIDTDSAGSQVKGNFIGVDVNGTTPITVEPFSVGISVRGLATTIGDDTVNAFPGSCTGGCNLISGFTLAGIVVIGGTDDARILANFIGTDITGTVAIPNLQGISSGGDGPGISYNLISGNTEAGLSLSGGSNAFVLGNRIGTDVTGMSALGNGTGIGITATDFIRVGGTSPTSKNVISANDAGITAGSGTTDLQVVGNFIGTAIDGITPLGNETGITLGGASDSLIGALQDNASNTIAFSRFSGITVRTAGSVHNAIRQNSIHSNGQLAGQGIDNSEGGNAELSPPVITGLGSLHGTACANCEVDIYSDSEDEGRIYEGTVTADANGDWAYDGPMTGPFMTAIANDADKNTSEFSAPFSLATPTPSPSPTAPPTPTPTPTATPVNTITPVPTLGPGLHQGDLNCDGEIDDADFLLLLEFVADVFDGNQSFPCLDIGEPDGETDFDWGDLNCDGVIDGLDALQLIAFRAGFLDVPHGVACTPIGQRI